MLALIIAAAGLAGAGPLTVVHDSGRTINAGPYRIAPPDTAALEGAVARAQADAAAGAGTARGTMGSVPTGSVDPGPMRPGEPRWVTTARPFGTVFALGGSDGSWLAASAARLRAAGARGFVVQARSGEEFAALAGLARQLGLADLAPVGGAAFGRMFGVATYPVVVVGRVP